MTREEAKQDIRDTLSHVYGLQFIPAIEEDIDCIFDDFEDRRCTACKHYKQSSVQEYHSCYAIKIVGFNFDPPNDFGCSKWESNQ